MIGAQDADAISENFLEQGGGIFEIAPVSAGIGEGVEWGQSGWICASKWVSGVLEILLH